MRLSYIKTFYSVAVSGILLFLCTSAISAEKSTDYQRYLNHRQEKLKDPKLVRYYAFDEKKGVKTANLVNPGKGDLVICRNSPYGEPLIKHVRRWEKINFCEWSEGRWSGKGALSSGESKFDTVRSGYYGPSGNQFTFESWVRLHDNGKSNFGATMFHLGDGYGSGWILGAEVRKWSPLGQIEFRLGTAKGPMVLKGSPFAASIWHQVVISWDGKNIKLYIDGELKDSKAFSGPFATPKQHWTWKQYPEEDLGGFSLGGASSKSSKDNYDVDEVLLYDRALSAEEIKKDYQAGKPSASDVQQKQNLAELLAKKERRSKIKLAIPHDTYGYFRRNKTIPVKVSVVPEALVSGKYKVEVVLRDQNGAKRDAKEKELTISDSRVKTELGIKIPLCGVYWLKIVLTNSKGEPVKTKDYPIAVTVPLPANDQIPLSSPMGCHAAFHSAQEKTVLGNSVNRIIIGWGAIERKKGEYDFSEPDIPINRGAERGIKTLFCIHLSPPAWMEKKAGSENLPEDTKALEKFLRVLVRRYKDRVPYWEIFNEPNSGLGMKGLNRVKDYVEFLKIAYRVIKEEDPKAVVVGFSGCPDFLDWSKLVLEAGGAPYLDAVSFHNYGAPPLQLNRRKQQVKKLRQLMNKYGRKDAPLWNTESGLGQLPRLDGRPMSEDQMNRLYADRIVNNYGQSVVRFWSPMTTEWQSACWQIQGILLDLMSGAEKYFTLSGSSRHGSMTDEGNGEPAVKGVAYAALASILMYSDKVTEIPMSAENEAAALVSGKDGKKTAILFAFGTPEATFRCLKDHKYQGMDMLGNPLNFNSGKTGLLTLKLSEAPVYIFDVGNNFEPVHFMRVTGAPDRLEQDNAFDGILNISNPFDSPLVCELKSIAPEGCSVQHEKQINLKANGSLKIPFKFKAKELRRKNYLLKFQLTKDNRILGSTEHKFFCPGTVFKVQEISQTIKLDGNTDEWKNIPEQKVDKEEFVVHGKPAPGVPWKPQWRGTNDLSFTVKSAWRKNDGLYLLINVTDNKPMPAPKDKRGLAFKWDCLEFFFDSREYSKRGGPMSDGADQVMIIPCVGEKIQVCDLWFVRKNQAMIKVNFVGKRTAKGYLLEGKITPKEASSFKLRAGSQFNMDFMLDDIDDPEKPRKAVMVMHGGMANPKVSGDWGRYQLEPGTK
jgi:hypothetical protein